MDMNAESSQTPELDHVEELLRSKLPRSPIYAFLLSTVHLVSARPGEVIARMTLSEHHMNSKKSLHGSVIATIVDAFGGLAISTQDLRENTGVSVDIHVTFQSGAKVGEDIEIEGVAEKVGGSLAFTRINIYTVEEGIRGKLVASGTHTKFVRGTAPAN